MDKMPRVYEILNRLVKEGKAVRTSTVHPDGVKLVSLAVSEKELASLSPEDRAALRTAGQPGMSLSAQNAKARHLSDILRDMKAAGHSVNILDIIRLSPQDKALFGVTDELVEQLTRVAQKLGLL